MTREKYIKTCVRKRLNSGKTTANVFFRNNKPKPKKNCEAWINKDGSIHCILIDGTEYKLTELADIGVVVVDIQQTITHYFNEAVEESIDEYPSRL